MFGDKKGSQFSSKVQILNFGLLVEIQWNGLNSVSLWKFKIKWNRINSVSQQKFKSKWNGIKSVSQQKFIAELKSSDIMVSS